MPDDSRLTDRLNIKYLFNPPDIWQTLVQECVANWNYYKILFPEKGKDFYSQRSPSAKKLKDIMDWERRLESTRDKISEFSNFVSSLASVDGAVVLSKHLKIWGFGAEIVAASHSINYINVAGDPEGRASTKVPINNFGTRHRSAVRLCSSFEDCVCLVISHDGTIRAIKRVGREIYIWNDVNLGMYGL
jgi:hypothetical protein